MTLSVNDTKEVLPCSVLLEGEYDVQDICIGVPVKIGKNGFEEVVQLDLSNKELEMFQNSVSAVKETNSALDGLIQIKLPDKYSNVIFAGVKIVSCKETH